jgi:uncharacterized protein DUF5069
LRRASFGKCEMLSAFVLKRAWRDAGTTELAASKRELGFADRQEVQSWVDLHDVDEGRVPRPVFSIFQKRRQFFIRVHNKTLPSPQCENRPSTTD